MLFRSLSYVGLTILGFPYVLPLALIAGIFEIIPIVGPIIAAIPAVLVGYGTFNLISNGAIDNHLVAVSAAWLAARLVGWPTWIYLWKPD